MIRAARGVALATLALVGAGCGTTTVDTATTRVVTAGAVTTAPTGPVDDLLARLQTRAYLLSTAVAEGDGTQALAEIEALWAAASAQLPRTDFVLDMERQVAALRISVERRRPADADKAARNVEALISARG